MIGSMHSFATDTAIVNKPAKAGGIGFGADTDATAMAFDALMAGLIGVTPDARPMSASHDTDALVPSNSESETSETATSLNATATMTINPQNLGITSTSDGDSVGLAKVAPSSDGAALNQNPQVKQGATGLLADASAVQGTPSAGMADADGFASNGTETAVLTGGVEDGAAQISPDQSALSALTDLLTATGNHAKQAQSSAPAATANAGSSAKPAAQVSPNGSAQSNAVESGETSSAVTLAPNASAPTGTEKQKSATSLIEPSAKATPKAGEHLQASLEGPSLGEPMGQSETTTATPTEQTPRPQVLTPHTIPMLAATMVRRLESGSKQFSMRLDPPELGQVEVKLTMEVGKKVRAVISADRPEALADLVRSARDLVRALNDAGLSVDENGLTFTLNDPAGDQRGTRQDQDQALGSAKKAATHPHSQSDETPTAALADQQNTPFQRWQRARIALTA
jgi:flagellar hook-length control protein FliK